MSNEMPEIGKISPEIFNELIFPRLGAKNKDILVGPQHGVDVGLVKIGNKAVSIKSDPIFIVPEYGWERAAWFAIHILASDSVTCALKPKFFSIDLNLPMEMTKKQLEIVWETMHGECEKLGVSIVAGHTARYENCHYPMVGGATIIGVGELDEYVTPKLAKGVTKSLSPKDLRLKPVVSLPPCSLSFWKKNLVLTSARKRSTSSTRCQLLKTRWWQRASG